MNRIDQSHAPKLVTEDRQGTDKGQTRDRQGTTEKVTYRALGSRQSQKSEQYHKKIRKFQQKKFQVKNC